MNNAFTMLTVCKHNIIETIMDVEFEQFMREYWYIIEHLNETQEVLDLYLNKENSSYYYEKPEEYIDPFKRHMPQFLITNGNKGGRSTLT